jgi:actin-related protein
MEAELDTKEFIVIDNGTGYIKAGYSGEDAPKIIIPTAMCVGESQEQSRGRTFDFNPDILKNPEKPLIFPIDRGVIKSSDMDWECMSYVWEHIIKTSMSEDLNSANVLITDSILNTRENRQKLASVFLDTIGVNSLGIMPAPVLSLFSIGKTKGTVVDVGCGLTSVVPIFEGYALPHAIQKIPLAGHDITSFIHSKLSSHLKPNQLFVSRAIKEEMTVAPLSYRKGQQLLSEEKRFYELPGGKIINVDQDILATAAEIVFNPSIIASPIKGLSDQVADSIGKCDLDLRPDMLGNIVLSGGTTMMKGFYERFDRDVKSKLEPLAGENEIRVHADSFRQHAAWIGGSMLASLSTFGNFMVIKKDEWGEDNNIKLSMIHKYSF